MSTLIRTIGDKITLRRAESLADYHACQDAQRSAWGLTEDGYVVPIATMVGANLHGGLVLGAFLPDGRAVAMSFAFLGRVDDRICLYSQLTGVIPGQQSLGLGYAIKQLQRDFAIADGLPSIAWAFDPLQARNAHFNLVKLGARARRYVVDMYGARSDEVNNTASSDRLIVEWDVSPAPRPGADRADAERFLTYPALIETHVGHPGLVEPLGVKRPAGADRVLLEVPADVSLLRRENPEMAGRWERAVRDAFIAAFEQGYVAVDFVRDDGSEAVRLGYVLERPRSPA
jgi:predicted GNAT superfamily acetyltransferase